MKGKSLGYGAVFHYYKISVSYRAALKHLMNLYSELKDTYDLNEQTAKDIDKLLAQLKSTSDTLVQHSSNYLFKEDRVIKVSHDIEDELNLCYEDFSKQDLKLTTYILSMALRYIINFMELFRKDELQISLGNTFVNAPMTLLTEDLQETVKLMLETDNFLAMDNAVSLQDFVDCISLDE